jgi:hypothetical protein
MAKKSTNKNEDFSRQLQAPQITPEKLIADPMIYQRVSKRTAATIWGLIAFMAQNGPFGG